MTRVTGRFARRSSALPVTLPTSAYPSFRRSVYSLLFRYPIRNRQRQGDTLKKSYAQRLEDYYLNLAFAGQPSGSYIDIGAGHPVEDNVSYWFYLQGWSGLVAEPQDKLLASYAQIRPRDIREHRLVGREAGTASFFRFDELHGLSTTSREAAEAATQFEKTFTTETMEVTTLRRLAEEHRLHRVDFLKVDVEGAEEDVLAGADWSSFRPRILLGEVISPGSLVDAEPAWHGLLIRHGYEFRLFDGLNRYYVANEEAELLARLPTEIAPWDIVEHW